VFMIAVMDCVHIVNVMNSISLCIVWIDRRTCWLCFTITWLMDMLKIDARSSTASRIRCLQ